MPVWLTGERSVWRLTI